MAQPTDIANVCCVALELSKTSWVIAFSPPPDGGKNSLHQIAAKDINRLLSFLESARLKAEREASRPLEIVVCYEVGYDGFWLARLLIAQRHSHHRVRSRELSHAAQGAAGKDRSPRC